MEAAALLLLPEGRRDPFPDIASLPARASAPADGMYAAQGAVAAAIEKTMPAKDFG